MTDAGWASGKDITQEGHYWYRDFEQDTQPDIVTVEGDGSEIEPFIVRWECADDELVENMTGQFLGPISPEAYHQGRVAGLKEACKHMTELNDRCFSTAEQDVKDLVSWVKRQAQGEQP